jgi:uncharacterized protein YndB with AHSA1/START domain
MTLTETTPKSQTESLSFEVDLQHSPAKVWRALTEPELLSEWLLPAVGLELAPGASFTFETDPQPGWDGVVACRFVEIEPQRKLSWTWVVGDIDTVVTFTLTETAAGTQLSIVQSGFKAHQKQNFGGARWGWKMMSEKLVDLLGRI